MGGTRKKVSAAAVSPQSVPTRTAHIQWRRKACTYAIGSVPCGANADGAGGTFKSVVSGVSEREENRIMIPRLAPRSGMFRRFRLTFLGLF